MINRLDRLRAELAERELDGILVTDPSNRFYLSGYSAHDHAPNESAGVLLIGSTEAALFTSPNNTQWAASEAPGFEISAWKRPWTGTVSEQIRRYGWNRVGFEDDATLVSTHQELLASLANKVTLAPTRGLVDRLRRVKDADELAALERALGLTDEVFDATVAALRPGMTEREIAWMTEKAFRDAGADGAAFPTSVASGPHTARPHHAPTERAIREGEPITIDMGASVAGYNGDLTRTVWLGEPDSRLKAVYNVVFEAQATALAGLRAGMIGKDGDSLARRVVEAAGHKDHFVHGLGHGLGIRVHEGPSLGTTSTDVLQPGEVVTVEPGVYVPGWGGVRIEDVVVITSDGCQVLTKAPKLSPL
ncbi:MAG: Xaa-Pro aminopeptidase [Thermomicrobiales bacterium]|nr:Xaa-Pro aminopeptidase [Thermomicrobiales bacterium]